MKKILFVFALFQFGFFTAGFAQFAEPAVTGANFVSNQVAVGQTSTLTVSFSNSGSSDAPANSIELTIAYPETYYATDGISAPTGTAASMFNWAFIAPNIWRGTTNSVVAKFSGGTIILQLKGITQTANFETTNINVQPVASFGAFTDSPSNNNLQPKLKITPVVVVADTDGDGVKDDQEAIDGTSPSDGCSYLATSQVYANTSAAWKSLDCDRDGLNNKEETTGSDDPATPSDPKGTPTDPRDSDSDNDGILDGADQCPKVVGVSPTGCPSDCVPSCIPVKITRMKR